MISDDKLSGNATAKKRNAVTDTTDVAIIGGGAVGSSIAYFLASNPDFKGRVVVLEPDPTYRFASSALSLSSIRLQFSTPTNIELSAFGIGFLREANERLAVDGEPANVGYIERPYMFLATAEGRDGEKAEVEHCRKRQEDRQRQPEIGRRRQS